MCLMEIRSSEGNSGMKMQGISSRAMIGYLTQIGNTSHFKVLFSLEKAVNEHHQRSCFRCYNVVSDKLQEVMVFEIVYDVVELVPYLLYT
jgi:hypothetical protein